MASSALLLALGTFILWGTTNFLIRYGEERTGIKPTQFTAILAFVFLEEKLEPKQWIGIATVIIGMVILRI